MHPLLLGWGCPKRVAEVSWHSAPSRDKAAGPIPYTQLMPAPGCPNLPAPHLLPRPGRACWGALLPGARQAHQDALQWLCTGLFLPHGCSLMEPLLLLLLSPAPLGSQLMEHRGWGEGARLSGISFPSPCPHRGGDAWQLLCQGHSEKSFKPSWLGLRWGQNKVLFGFSCPSLPCSACHW